ncbi:MAG: hypothetical protein IID55_13355, partial [Proteobacteria bacterium]|nr:hypothetical protein [Pseudomonadota bacterium]
MSHCMTPVNRKLAGAGNARLTKIGHSWCEDVAVRRALSGKDKVRRFFQTGYQAGSWS